MMIGDGDGNASTALVLLFPVVIDDDCDDNGDDDGNDDGDIDGDGYGDGDLSKGFSLKFSRMLCLRGSRRVLHHLKEASDTSKTPLDILVCPLSNQPLRHCQENQSLISDQMCIFFSMSSSRLIDEQLEQ